MIGISLWENADNSIEHGLEHLETAIKNDNAYDYKKVVVEGDIVHNRIQFMFLIRYYCKDCCF